MDTWIVLLAVVGGVTSILVVANLVSHVRDLRGMVRKESQRAEFWKAKCDECQRALFPGERRGEG